MKPAPECVKCPLYERPGPVWGSGPGDAALGIITDHPTGNDVKEGALLTGGVGNTLANGLYKGGAQRGQVFYTSLVKCLVHPREGVPPEAIRCCAPLLEREISLLPRLTTLLTLGASAFNTLTGKILISKPAKKNKKLLKAWLRGCVDEVLTTRGAKWLIPAMHPRDIIETGFTQGVWEWESDLRKAVRISKEGPREIYEEINYLPSIKETVEYVGECIAKKEVGVDIETDWEEEKEDVAGRDEVKVTVVGLSHSPGSALGVPPDLFPLIRPLFTAHPEVTAYAHNWGGAERFYLSRLFGPLSVNAFCTMLAFHTLYPQIKPLDLGVCLSMFTDMGYHKNLMWSQPEVYNARDTYGCLWAGQEQRKLLTRLQLWEDFNSKMALVPVCEDMRLRGIKCNVDRADRYTIVAAEALAHYKEVATRLLPGVNLSSPTQLITLFKRMGLPEVKVKRKRKDREDEYTPSVDEDTLKMYASKHGSEWARLVLLMRKLESAGEFTSFHGKDGRAHPSFRIHGQAFGRIQTREPNLQNIPKEIVGMNPREIVVPDTPDDILILCDFEQVDLWTYVWCAGDTSLMAAKARGEYIYGVFWEESGMFEKPFFIEGAPKCKDNMSPAITHAELRAIKSGPLGLIYGRGEKGLQEGFKCSKERAHQMYERFFAQHPTFRNYHRDLMERARRDRYLKNHFGAIARFSNPEAMRNEILAFPGQSNAHGVQVHNLLLPLARELPALGARLVLQVHDDVLVNAPKRNAIRCMDLIKQTAEAPIKQMGGFTIPCVVSGGPTWGTQYSYKKCKELYS